MEICVTLAIVELNYGEYYNIFIYHLGENIW